MVTYNESNRAAIAQLESLAVQAHRAGREQDLLRHWQAILDLDPAHIRTLTALGQWAFRRGDFPAALQSFQRVVDTSGDDPQDWVNLALAHQQLQNEAEEEAAIQAALKRDPGYLLALLLKGGFHERRGARREAARAFGAAATVAPPLEQLSPELRPSVMHAQQFKAQYDRDCAAFLDQHLAAAYGQLAGEKLKRFRDSVDIMVGRKRRYDSWSHGHHYPGLPAIEFFERADFPWLDEFEARTDAIRDEFLGVLQSEDGFTPYISYPEGTPLNQWAELNNSPRWSAFHLFKNGRRIAANAERAPKTMALLSTAPQPVQQGRTPAAMFSLLKPKTRIPPHTGISNVRLVTHVPLIIPEGCGFRVGNETRGWEPGRAFVFDDTIEHEAWNDSDKLRVVLIFDIWHPMLTEAERHMVAALAEGLNQFSGETSDFDL
ncbi:MAG: aspartyl/asparaginyl beta-hydroxylase domain-containing protein [Betaproteobacteria bacterium]|nr:aspartyl/asparaginyl beta-hydroxylase domain-containing protein [Betaproteobacteria bacterium]